MTKSLPRLWEQRTEEFRALPDMSEPDRRQACLNVKALQDQWFRAKTRGDHHSIVDQYPLVDKVPESIQIQWETARNLWLYAWHVWRFYAVAEKQVYTTLELALREKLGHSEPKKSPGLQKLIEKAVKRRLVVDEAIEHYRMLQHQRVKANRMQNILDREGNDSHAVDDHTLDPQAYCKVIQESFSQLRNSYAHGSTSIAPSIDLTFSISRDLINQLYS